MANDAAQGRDPRIEHLKKLGEIYDDIEGCQRLTNQILNTTRAVMAVYVMFLAWQLGLAINDWFRVY